MLSWKVQRHPKFTVISRATCRIYGLLNRLPKPIYISSDIVFKNKTVHLRNWWMEGQIHGALYQRPATFGTATSKISLTPTRKRIIKNIRIWWGNLAKYGLLMVPYISTWPVWKKKNLQKTSIPLRKFIGTKITLLYHQVCHKCVLKAF